MRVQGYDYKIENGVLVLNTKRTIRIASGLFGVLFLLLSLWLWSNEKNLTFLIYLAIGILLLGAAVLSEEMRISKKEIEYKRAFPYRTQSKFPFENLKSIHHGEVDLLIGRTAVPGYRVWLKFEKDLPIAVVFEKTIQWNKDAPIKGQEIAQELSASIGIPISNS